MSHQLNVRFALYRENFVTRKGSVFISAEIQVRQPELGPPRPRVSVATLPATNPCH